MSVVEPGNCWDAIPNEEFDNILNILDFPMENLEHDGFVADWDITKLNCLGPIPSTVLMDPPIIADVKVDTGPPFLSSGLVAHIAEAQEQKQASNLPQESSVVFQTQSPVSVLESSGRSCSSGKSAVTVRARSKRHKRTSSWLSPSTYFITDKRTPSSQKDNKDKKKKLTRPNVENSLRGPNHPAPALTKRCTHCQVTKTPQWREGPLGPKTLCNACGVRYRSGRLFPEYRPAASPTFVPALHSNSHKKVVEMRSKGEEPIARMKEPPESPQPEFVPMSNYLFDYIY